MKQQFSKNNKHWLILLLNTVLSLTIILFIDPPLWFLSIISIYFYLIGTISSFYLSKKIISAPNRFISQYMLISMIKLVLHLVVLVILFIFFKNRFLIAGIFFLNYIISTIYEASLWLSTKNKS